MELVKLIRNSGSSLEKAELRFKMADLVEALADLKMQLAAVQEDMAGRDKRILELEGAFEVKDELRRVNDAYYRVGADGKQHGPPRCMRCWEVDKVQRSVVHSAERGLGSICPACKSTYRNSHTGTFI